MSHSDLFWCGVREACDPFTLPGGTCRAACDVLWRCPNTISIFVDQILTTFSSPVNTTTAIPACTSTTGTGWRKPAAVSLEPQQRGAPTGRNISLITDPTVLFCFCPSPPLIGCLFCCFVAFLYDGSFPGKHTDLCGLLPRLPLLLNHRSRSSPSSVSGLDRADRLSVYTTGSSWYTMWTPGLSALPH